MSLWLPWHWTGRQSKRKILLIGATQRLKDSGKLLLRTYSGTSLIRTLLKVLASTRKRLIICIHITLYHAMYHVRWNVLHTLELKRTRLGYNIMMVSSTCIEHWDIKGPKHMFLFLMNIYYHHLYFIHIIILYISTKENLNLLLSRQWIEFLCHDYLHWLPSWPKQQSQGQHYSWLWWSLNLDCFSLSPLVEGGSIVSGEDFNSLMRGLSVKAYLLISGETWMSPRLFCSGTNSYHGLTSVCLYQDQRTCFPEEGKWRNKLFSLHCSRHIPSLF